LICGFFEASLGKLILTTDNPDGCGMAGFIDAFEEDLEASEFEDEEEPDKKERWESKIK
jgi:hypothetical protein